MNNSSPSPSDWQNREQARRTAMARRLSRMALFVAAAVALGYLLSPVPNLELISLTVALAGLSLGAMPGLIAGGLTMAIYGGLNAWGLPFPPVWAAQILGMALFGVVFGLLRRVFIRLTATGRMLLAGSLGLALTAVYDFLTTIAYPLAAGLLFSHNWYAYIVAGIPFFAMHVVTNTVVFVVLLPVVYRRVVKRWSEAGVG